MIPLSLGLLLALAPSSQGDDAPRRLSLEEALAIALKQNPDVAEAQSRLAEAEARVQAAQAGRWPYVKARGAYDYGSKDQRLFPATHNNEPGAFGAQIFSAELTGGFSLYTGGRVSGETDAANWTRRATSAQLQRVREMLAYQVTAFFYGLLAQDEVLRSLETAVRAMDEQQRITQALVDADKAARVDVLRTNVRRAELYERQVREHNNRVIQQRAWAVLLGWDNAEAPEADGQLALRELPVCPDAGECLREALSERTDYKAARAIVEAQKAAIKVARAGHLPTLSVLGDYGGRWMPDASDRPAGVDDGVDVGRVGVVAEISIFDGRLTAAKVSQERARLSGAQERLRKLELQIHYEVETALADIASARERVKTFEQAVGQAEESFRIMKEKYDLGKGIMTEVLDTQAELVVQQTSYARALADLAVADARRKLAVGEILP